MIGTPAIRNLIRENKVAQMYSAIQTGQQYGMQTLDQNLQELVKRNVVTVAEARVEGGEQGQLPRVGRCVPHEFPEGAWRRPRTGEPRVASAITGP